MASLSFHELRRLFNDFFSEIVFSFVCVSIVPQHMPAALTLRHSAFGQKHRTRLHRKDILRFQSLSVFMYNSGLPNHQAFFGMTMD